MVYVPEEGRILAFGGWTGSRVAGDTWVWQNGWQHLQIDGPSKRSAFGMAYRHDRQEVVLFGGLWISGQYADLWSWKAGKWSARSGPYDHSSLDHHQLIFHEGAGQLLIFGGKNYRYQMQQSTLLVEQDSIGVLTREGPAPRHSIGITYHQTERLVYIYGGKEYRDGEQIALSDLWYWDGKQWHLRE